MYCGVATFRWQLLAKSLTVTHTHNSVALQTLSPFWGSSVPIGHTGIFWGAHSNCLVLLNFSLIRKHTNPGYYWKIGAVNNHVGRDRIFHCEHGSCVNRRADQGPPTQPLVLAFEHGLIAIVATICFVHIVFFLLPKPFFFLLEWLLI